MESVWLVKYSLEAALAVITMEKMRATGANQSFIKEQHAAIWLLKSSKADPEIRSESIQIAKCMYRFPQSMTFIFQKQGIDNMTNMKNLNLDQKESVIQLASVLNSVFIC